MIERRTARWERRVCVCLLLLPIHFGPAHLRAEGNTDLETANLVIAGAREISEEALRRAMKGQIENLHSQGFRKSGIDDLAYEIERYYRGRGYHFVRVTYRYGEAEATLTIAEGPRVLLGTVAFKGNTVIGDEALAALAPRGGSGLLGLGAAVYVKSYVSSLASAVEKAYRRDGYLEVRVAAKNVTFSTDQTQANVQIEISEGRQYVLEAVILTGSDVAVTAGRIDRFQALAGSAYAPLLRLEVKTAVEDLYADEGYPDAVAEVVALPTETEQQVRMTLEVEVTAGAKTLIGDILIEGNERVRRTFILNQMRVKSGDLYRGRTVRRSYRRLFETGLFSAVAIDLKKEESPGHGERANPSEEEVSHRDLHVQVSERPSRERFYEVGFGSYDLLRGKTGIRERNLFGRGLIGSAEVGASIRGAQLKFSLTDPWFLQSQWKADLPVSFLTREEPSFTIRESKVGFRLSKPLTERWTIGSTYRFSLSHVQNLSAQSPFKEETNLHLGALGPFLQYDSRNDLFMPTRGVNARAFAEVGDPALAGEISFVHIGASASHYVELKEGTVLCSRVATRWIAPIRKTESIPIQERLFNGGENSVRSFRQSELGPKDAGGDPVGGEVRNLLSLELRQRIAGHFAAALFADYGNVGLTTGEAFEDFRSALGLGLRYGLPIGPIRLDVGFNPKRRPGEDRFVIHFAVGMPF
ncbi:MAG: BamA/TamA family outer membrane protein [Planctomycetes bacterium]|nr:BamA/TamA family outer membrane protein [Planctomycetota bacterium]